MAGDAWRAAATMQHDVAWVTHSDGRCMRQCHTARRDDAAVLHGASRATDGDAAVTQQELHATDDDAQRQQVAALHADGKSKAAIARQLGIHRSTVTRWLRGEGDP